MVRETSSRRETVGANSSEYRKLGSGLIVRGLGALVSLAARII
jgi:hypothetical protein